MRSLLLLCLVLSASVLRAQEGVPAEKANVWKAGAASAVITPKTMMWMAGYASRTKPAEAVDMDLFAKSLVLDDGDNGLLAIVTMDLISVPRAVRLAVAERVQKEYGIPPERLLLNASHTHCGPELRSWRAPKNEEGERRVHEAVEYSEFLVDTLTRLVGEALEKRVPATADYTHARCGFAMNRRQPTGQSFRNAPYSDGPVDHRVPVLRLVDQSSGKPLAILFGYACHNTTLGWQKFSGDYAGAAQAFLEARHPGAVVMFMNGCSGDQNPYPRSEPELVEAHGRTLALAVEAALLTPPKPLSGPIQAGLKEIPLPFERLPERSELEVRAKSKDTLDAGLATRLLEKLDAGEQLDKDYPYPVQVIRFGKELTLVALGGEVVVDYSLRLQSEINDPVVWVAGYSNDVMTYIPSRRVWEEGGYEGGEAMKWNSFPSRWSPNIEEQIVKTVLEVRGGL